MAHGDKCIRTLLLLLTRTVFPITTSSYFLPRPGLDWFVAGLHHRAAPLRAVLLPERLRQGGGVLLRELRGQTGPRVDGRQAHPLRLRRAIRAGPGLGEVLLVVRLGKEPQAPVLVVLRGRLHFGGDGGAQSLLVGLFAGQDQLLLLVVKVVKAGPAMMMVGVTSIREDKNTPSWTSLTIALKVQLYYIETVSSKSSALGSLRQSALRRGKLRPRTGKKV